MQKYFGTKFDWMELENRVGSKKNQLLHPEFRILFKNFSATSASNPGLILNWNKHYLTLKGTISPPIVSALD